MKMLKMQIMIFEYDGPVSLLATTNWQQTVQRITDLLLEMIDLLQKMMQKLGEDEAGTF